MGGDPNYLQVLGDFRGLKYLPIWMVEFLMKNVGEYTNLMDPMEMNSFDTVPDLFLLYTASSPPKLDLSMWNKHVKLSTDELDF